MNRWKAFALVMIGLLAVSVGLRFTYLEEHSFPIDEEQKLFAINAAKNGLRDEKEINNYNITIQEKGRIIPTANGDKKVVRVILTHENITRVEIIPGDDDRGQKKKNGQGSRLASELGKKDRESASEKFEAYQGHGEEQQEANHEKIKGRENRRPVVEKQFHGVLSYCIGVIVERRGQNEIFDPGQRNILNGKKTPGDHGQNEPHNRRTRNFALAQL